MAGSKSRCPICGNEEFIPLERVQIKNQKYPDHGFITTAYCVGCGNIYGALVEMVVRT